LSTNWLIRQICFYIVEFMRNTPLLIQLTFWYTVVFMRLPNLASVLKLPGGAVISRQGIWLPWPSLSEMAPGWTIAAMAIGAVILIAALFKKRLRRTVVLLSGFGLVFAALAGGLVAVDQP